MEKNQRQKIYDWIIKNKNNHNAEYRVSGNYITVPYADYIRIGARIRQTYNKIASYQTVRREDDMVTMRISIK